MLDPLSVYTFQSSRSPATTSSAALQSLLLGQSRTSELRYQLGRTSSVRSDRGLLFLFQAVNAGGKDGVVEELVSVLGEDNVRVERFRRPPSGEADRDLLNLASRLAPAPGELVFFNRSYYEAPLRAAMERLPNVAILCERIVQFESRLAKYGSSVVKLFLHIDKIEQLRRLEDRQIRPELRHLHNPRDYEDQERWDDLMRAYETVMSNTHTISNPWLVIPSNVREIRNNAVQEVLASVLR